MPAAAVAREQLRPVHLRMLGEERLELRLLAVAADADDRQVLAVLALQPDEIGQRAHARTAPAGPEVDQHDLALPRSGAERLAVEQGAGDVEWLVEQPSRIARRPL